MNPLKEKYLNEVVPAMQKTLNLENPMQYPKIEKIVVNIGLGEALDNPKALDAAVGDLTQITGQKPIVTKARVSIANFKLREALFTQFTCDRPEDTGTLRIDTVAVKDNAGVIIEANGGSVFAAPFFGAANDHGLYHIGLLHGTVRSRGLYGTQDSVTDISVAANRATEDVENKDFFCAGVIGDT